MEEMLIAKELLFKTKIRNAIEDSIVNKTMLSRGDVLRMFNEIFDRDEIYSLLREEVETNVNELYAEATDKLREIKRDKSYTYRLNRELLEKQFITYMQSAYKVYMNMLGEALNELDTSDDSSLDETK